MYNKILSVHRKSCIENSGFTLIELLIVVAILGILASIGVVQYTGYQNQARVNATKSNHETVINLIMGTYANCSAGVGTVTLGTATQACTASATTFATVFETYFNSIDMKNPYTLNDAISIGAAGTNDGTTYLTVSGSTTTVTTIASPTETLTANIFKE